MKKTSKLLEKESTINQEIQSLGQKTIDSSLKENLADNFTELNDRRRELTKLVRELNSLRTQGFQEFKENLPEIENKYNTLNCSLTAKIAEVIIFNIFEPNCLTV